MKRRTLLKLIGGGVASFALPRGLWSGADAPRDDFFVFIHAAGGWDVTLWADPRNERKGLIEPPSTANMDAAGIKRWRNAPLDGHFQTFEVLAPSDRSMRLGPAIGDLFDLRDRITVINGIAMNTVSHDDGTVYSTTGRHLAGGTRPESSIDVVVANELGVAQLMPDVAVGFPSAFVGASLDQRAIPLRIATVDAFTKVLERTDNFLGSGDRDAISSALQGESSDLMSQPDGQLYQQLASQQRALPALIRRDFVDAFSAKQLKTSYPQFTFAGRGEQHAALGAAFAIEAMRRNLVRCVSFASTGFDTHTTNYREHARTLQELFDTVATLVKVLDATPHPTLQGTKLSERTHILVVSEFCRTPQINLMGGRDHYPNNSALVISSRFRRGQVFGQTDVEQLLPTPFGKLPDGVRALAPPDILATFLGAFGIDPRKYMRDGAVVRELLA
jgi:hypothetical protein